MTRKKKEIYKDFEVWQTLLVADLIGIPEPSLLLQFAFLQRKKQTNKKTQNHHTCVCPAYVEVRDSLLRDSLEGSLSSFLLFQLQIINTYFSDFMFFLFSGAYDGVKHLFGHYDINPICFTSYFITSLHLLVSFSPFSITKNFSKCLIVQPLHVFLPPVS